ncbi:MAG TPA: hypothetical protein VK203_24230 [Nostocaceae cyanobacterium]|nr:hypothetical protein [Nostocaceae cyanobacterium]
MTDDQEVAKQRDIEAIANLLNTQLQSQGVTVQTTFTDNCLAIMLESSQVPNSEVLVEFIRQELTNLNVESFDQVRVFGRLKNDIFPSWKQEFNLHKQQTVLELAKQGDSQAITEVFNFLLNPHNINAKVMSKNGYLYVVLQAEGKVPNQQQSVSYVRKLINHLELFSLKRVQVYGWLKGAGSHAWTQQIDLTEFPTES